MWAISYSKWFWIWSIAAVWVPLKKCDYQSADHVNLKHELSGAPVWHNYYKVHDQ